MSALQESDIDKLASLARLSVVPSERAGLAKDIDAILGYISELESVKLVGETHEKADLRNIARPDVVAHESGAHTAALLASSPRAEGEYFVVKKVL